MISRTTNTSMNIVPNNISSVITAINKELKHLAEFEDVHATILFRLDGQVLKSRYCKDGSHNFLMIMSWVKNIILKTTEELRRGSRSIKYNKEIGPMKRIPVYFYRTGNSSILVTLLHSKANTGLMEIEMSRSSRRLGMIIDKKASLGD
jgi:predicted regulator of Ras-like GTPase activity (Roadblock/LC7/MglB family)